MRRNRTNHGLRGNIRNCAHHRLKDRVHRSVIHSFYLHVLLEHVHVVVVVALAECK